MLVHDRKNDYSRIQLLNQPKFGIRVVEYDDRREARATLLFHTTKDAIVIIICVSWAVAKVDIRVAGLSLYAIRIPHPHLALVRNLVRERGIEGHGEEKVGRRIGERRGHLAITGLV